MLVSTNACWNGMAYELTVEREELGVVALVGMLRDKHGVVRFSLEVNGNRQSLCRACIDLAHRRNRHEQTDNCWPELLPTLGLLRAHATNKKQKPKKKHWNK